MSQTIHIIGIDISSVKIKIGLIKENGSILCEYQSDYSIYEDGDFGKKMDLDEIWTKILEGMKYVISNSKIDPKTIVAISSDTMRMAFIGLDKKNEAVYAGPNIDARGTDSQWIIDDEFEGVEGEQELFSITARSPPLLFGLARLLWFREEDEEIFEKIEKFVSFDDWIQFKLTGNLVIDECMASETQAFDIKNRTWSQEILKRFELNDNIFPSLVKSGTITGYLKEEIIEKLQLDLDPNLKLKIAVVKAGPDTQTSLLGMGCILNKNKNSFNLGITLGSSAPLMLVVDKPIIDPNMNFWTSCNILENSWIIEANTGMTGKVYNWFKNNILVDLSDNLDRLVEKYLNETEPGANSTFAFLGPEKMNFKEQTNIKQSIFVFPSQSTISDIKSNRATFTRAVIENIGFGVYENYIGLKEIISPKEIENIYVSGGMANSKEILQIICDILGRDIYFPQVAESAYIGMLILSLVALKRYSTFEEAISNVVKLNKLEFNANNHERYKKIYKQWKNIKSKIDNL
ncbi:MAG: FGGY family carbohydrate kinase [Promethearchaeota archaeon]